MKNNFKKKLQSFLSRESRLSIKNLLSNFIDIYSIKSYSQEGEDMILYRILEYVENGFYIDVGAHHPKRFSNTYFFYEKGWSGINIDATPGSMKLFDRIRPRDINIEAAIAKTEKEMTFFIFDDPALNTFDEELAHTRNSETYSIIAQTKIKTTTLSNILLQNMPSGKDIDFMSIDAEGFDLEVLKSNDWELFRPKCILIESINLEIESLDKSEIYRYLSDRKYQIIAKSFNTLIFKDKLFERKNNA